MADLGAVPEDDAPFYRSPDGREWGVPGSACDSGAATTPFAISNFCLHPSHTPFWSAELVMWMTPFSWLCSPVRITVRDGAHNRSRSSSSRRSVSCPLSMAARRNEFIGRGVRRMPSYKIDNISGCYRIET